MTHSDGSNCGGKEKAEAKPVVNGEGKHSSDRPIDLVGNTSLQGERSQAINGKAPITSRALSREADAAQVECTVAEEPDAAREAESSPHERACTAHACKSSLSRAKPAGDSQWRSAEASDACQNFTRQQRAWQAASHRRGS